MDKKFTIDYIDLSELSKEERKLIEALNASLYMGDKDPKKSIMHHGQICNHDDGFLCEHRLQFIVNWLKLNKFGSLR